MIELVLLVVSLILVLMCGIFVAAEFALIAVNRNTVERLVTKGDRRAIGVSHALSTLSTQLSSAQVGITITNLAIGFLAEPAISKVIEPVLTQVGFSQDLIPGIAIALGLIIATIITMLFGELVPKNLAISRPMATAKVIQRPLLLFTAFMKWPIRLLNGSANFILRQMNVEPLEELASARSADELLSLVRRSAEKGTLTKETALMLERSLNFGDLTALDVMTPRVRVQALEATEHVSDLLKLAQTTGFSRFPIYDENLDHILGVAHIKHAFVIPRSDRATTSVRDIMRPAVLVPSNIELESLLEDLRRGGLQMAILIDEFGAVDGIVTIEDLLEELVGEVKDEHDHSSAAIRKRANGSWLLSGLLRPDEIGEELNIYLPEEEDTETIAGLITHYLGRIPDVGDFIELEAVDRDGDKLRTELKVERMDELRIDRIQLRILKGPQTEIER